MKYQNYLLCAAVVLLGACESENHPLSQQSNQMVKVSFNIKLEPEIVSFGTKAMPGNLPDEPEADTNTPVEPPTAEPDTENTSSMLSTVEYAVFNNDLELVKLQSIDIADQNSLNITDVFEAGIYTFCFLAHPFENVSAEGNILSFPDELKECFYSSNEYEVETGTDFNETITLDRIVSKIEIVPTDKLPDKVTSYQITASGTYNAFDILNGHATATTTPFSRTVTFSAEDYAAAKGPSHHIYTFVPQTEPGTIGSINLKALDKDGDLLREKTITDAPLHVNRITRYTGTLYNVSSDASFVFEINDEWGEPDEYEIKEE